jgi:hypothetical protein
MHGIVVLTGGPAHTKVNKPPLVPRQPTFAHYRRVASDPALWDNYASISPGRLAELLDCEGPEVSLSIPGAVSALPTVGCRVRFVENVSASAESLGVVGVGVGDPHVGPSVADVAAVQHLGLVGLGDGNPAVPSDLSCVVADPYNLQPEQVAKFGHGLLHIEVGETGIDHVTHLPTRPRQRERRTAVPRSLDVDVNRARTRAGRASPGASKCW